MPIVRGNPMVITKRYIPILLFLSLISCASNKAYESSRKLFTLKSISTYDDRENQSKKKVLGYIELNRIKPNRVTVFNLCTYELFQVDRSDNPNGSYYRLGTLKSSTVHPYGGTCTLVSFEDKQKSTIASRYKIIPVVEGRDQEPLEIQYVTDDQTIYQEIERSTK